MREVLLSFVSARLTIILLQ